MPVAFNLGVTIIYPQYTQTMSGKLILSWTLVLACFVGIFYTYVSHFVPNRSTKSRVEQEHIAENAEKLGRRMCSQKERLHHVKETCRVLHHSPRVGANVEPACLVPVINEEAGLFYCAVYKAGYASWKSALKSHIRGSPRLLERKEYASIPPSYISFTVVRHPFSRLLSAYEDKIVGANSNNGGTFSALRQGIIKSFREDSTKTSLDLTMPTFLEFGKYVIADDTVSFSGEMKLRKRDAHWRPQVELTNPCEFNFRYILRLEALGNESLLIFDALGDKWDGGRMPHENQSNANKEWIDVFYKLPKKYVKRLLEYYKYDFLIFGYRWDVPEKCDMCFCKVNSSKGECC